MLVVCWWQASPLALQRLYRSLRSGSRYGYGLLVLQILLIPVLFMAQDLTVRLGVCTGQGHSACIRDHFGPRSCWFATILLMCECVVAMVSEMSGVAATGRLWGMSYMTSVLTASFAPRSIEIF